MIVHANVFKHAEKTKHANVKHIAVRRTIFFSRAVVWIIKQMLVWRQTWISHYTGI